jgi:GT2 family glycosyltransferase
MIMPKVEIILLNWNGFVDTINCLQSITKLDYEKFGVIVVDNGSTDSSVTEIKKAFPGQRIIETGSNLGFSGGCNYGIRDALSRGADCVWLLNNDAVVEAKTLSHMVEVAKSSNHVGAVGSIIYHMDKPDCIQAWGGGRINRWLGRSQLCMGPCDVDYISGASMLVPRQPLEDIGLLDESYFMYWEDADYCMRLRNAGYRLVVSAESRLYHNESSSVGRGSLRQIEYFNCSAVRFYKSNYEFAVIPIMVGAGGRFIKQVMRGRLNAALTVIRSSLRCFRT